MIGPPEIVPGVARRRFVVLGSGDIFYHLTYVDDLVEGFRCAGKCRPRRIVRTFWPEARSPTLTELIKRIAREAHVAPPSIKLPACHSGSLVRLRGVCVPLGIEPPLYRRRVDFFTKSRAFESRARGGLGYSPQMGLNEGIQKKLLWYREHGWM